MTRVEASCSFHKYGINSKVGETKDNLMSYEEKLNDLGSLSCLAVSIHDIYVFIPGMPTTRLPNDSKFSLPLLKYDTR